MRRVFLISLFVLAFVVSTRLFSFSGPAVAADVNIPGWNLVFDDEFDEASLDYSKYQEYWGPVSASWWNGKQALSTQNGALHLLLNRQDAYQNGTTYHYTAGGFTQKSGQTYGRWVVRARFPQGAGTQAYICLWPAVSQWPPEIDFAEVVGGKPTENVFSLHYGNASSPQWDGMHLYGPDYTADFHEYTLIWQPGSLTWLVDGVQQYTTSTSFDTIPMQLAVADLVGACDSFSGCPDGNTPFPQSMDIDYIRVYQKS